MPRPAPPAASTSGDRFDVRAFHDQVLGSGALPLDVLDARIRQWVRAQSALSSR